MRPRRLAHTTRHRETMITLSDIERLDREDPLSRYLEKFEKRPGWIFFDANSMGPMPKSVRKAASAMLDDWVELRRCGWSQREWVEGPQIVGDGFAHWIGAGPGEVTVCDNTTLNIYKLAAQALRMNADRSKIVTQSGNFPTDLHVLQGFVEQSGGRLRIVLADTESELIAAIDADTALVALCHAEYRSGDRWDMAAINDAAHAVGALTLWDLSHTAGAVKVDLNGTNADFAVGCGYKYLSGGLGSPAYLWVRPDLLDAKWPVIAGWMGHADIYAFAEIYEPIADVRRHLTGTPTVGANEIFRCATDIWKDIDVRDLDARHKSLSDTLIALLEQECGDLGVVVTSTRDHAKRGGHVSFTAPGAGNTVEALLGEGVVGSFRKPDSIRFGVGPFALSHADLWEAVQRLKDVLVQEKWRDERFAEVTV